MWVPEREARIWQPLAAVAPFIGFFGKGSHKTGTLV